MAVRGASGETDPGWGGLMQGVQEQRPRCSGSRMIRRVATVAPAAVLMTMAFGTTGAMAAAGGNSTHAGSAASPNMGVGNGNGNGNQTHQAAMSSGSSSGWSSTSAN